MKKSIFIGEALFAFLLVSGFHCWAQGNEIQACYQKNNGQLRIVSNPSDCRSTETSISWDKMGPQAKARPRVYDAKGQFLGVLPSDLLGAVSIYIPTLSKFIWLSSDSGDVDPFFPAVYLYFDGINCTGTGYVNPSLRYQILKVGSHFVKTDDVDADCKEIKSLSEPGWQGERPCRSYSANCIPVLPYKEVTLPFTMPVALPFYFEY